MNVKKRGISPIIATLLIIMMTVAAIAVLYSFIVPFVKNSLDKSTECTRYRDYFLFDESTGFNCYKKYAGETLYGVSIKESFDAKLLENIAGFALKFTTKEGTARTAKVEFGQKVSQGMGGVWVLAKTVNPVLQAQSPGQVKTYIYNGTTSELFESIEVHPLLKSGTICKEMDSITISTCPQGRNLTA